jgi:hypothetical protein
MNARSPRGRCWHVGAIAVAWTLGSGAACSVDAATDGDEDVVDVEMPGTDDARPFTIALDPTTLSPSPAAPFGDEEGPPIVSCGAGGVLVEGGSLDIRTGACDPADVTTSLPVAIPAGTRLDVAMSHGVLVADGGSAHLAVLVGDEVVWEHEVTLPAPAAFLAPRVTIGRDHGAGEPVTVHVHNHGANVYSVHGLRFIGD